MRKMIVMAAVAACGAATAVLVPGASATQQKITTTLPNEITVIPGACVTEPCPFPVVITIPDRP